MNEGPLAARRRLRKWITIDRIATAIVVTLSVALSIMILAVVFIVLFAPSAIPPGR